MNLSEIFAKECRDEQKYYFERSKMAKAEGLLNCRRVYLGLAWQNRRQARKWEAE